MMPFILTLLYPLPLVIGIILMFAVFWGEVKDRQDRRFVIAVSVLLLIPVVNWFVMGFLLFFWVDQG